MSSLPLFELAHRYDVLEEIGRGGHAIVYRAHDRVLGRDVAIKLLNHGADAEMSIARFTQEVRVTASLEHAHILHVHDTGQHEGRPYLVMELATDGTLEARLARESQLPVLEALQIAREIALALSFAHQRGVLHRDIKPANILLGRGGAMLADFGVAFVSTELDAERLTNTGVAVGTVQYMSPEQLCAERELDGRSDQYALACVLYEMLAGVRPHIAASAEGLRLQRMTGRHLPIREHRPSVPAPIEAALQTAMSPVPADRFRDIDAFHLALSVSQSFETAIPISSSNVKASGARQALPGSATTGRASADAHNSVAVGRSLSKTRWLVPLAVAVVLTVSGFVYLQQGGARDSESLVDGSVSVSLAENSEQADSLAWQSRVHQSVRNELGAWQGVRVVERFSTRDSLALHFVPEVSVIGDSLRILLTVHRSSGTTPHSVSAMLPVADLATSGALIAGLVREALAGATPSEAPGVGALPERSLLALRAHVRGHMLLRAGELDSASAAFRSALQASPRFGHAAYWAAQTAAWRRPGDIVSWSTLNETALRSGTLRGSDSLLAAGLMHLAQQEFPRACDAYEQVTQRDPQSWVAWYGQGDCRRFDSLVVRSGNGLAYRGSSWRALSAYRRWSALVPTSALHAAMFAPVMRSTFALSSNSRAGHIEDSVRTRFISLPSLQADTLAFVPVPEDEFQRAGPASVPRSWQPALSKGREIALDITRGWIERSPESADAWFHRAIALELAGQFDRNRVLSADAALSNAQAKNASGATQAKIQVARVRLALRRGSVEEAVTLARTILADTTASVSSFAPLAAFVGALDDARRLNALGRSVNASMPSSFADSLHEFRLRAQLGACEGLMERKRALDALFSSSVSTPQQPALREELLLPAYRDAAPCLGASVLRGLTARVPLDAAYARLADGDTVGARRVLQEVRARRAGATSSTVTWDYLFAESWALVQVGDTVSARAQLRSALDDIGSMSMYTLDFAAQAAGLRRGLLLLASLREREGARGATLGAWEAKANAFSSTGTRGGVR